MIGRQLRSSGGIVLQIGADQFHLDPGPGALTLSKQAQLNARATTAILLSSNHLHHANDINALIDAMTYHGFDKKGVLVGCKTATQLTEDSTPLLHPLYKSLLERVITLEASNKVGINDIEIHALKTLNPEKHALGYKFITPDFTLSYTGDTQYRADIADQYQGSDVLILNTPNLTKNDGKFLNKQDANTIIQAVKPKLAILTNFGINFLKSNPIYEVRELQRNSSAQVIAAKDGMMINPTNYSFSQSQKTLFKFSPQEGVRVHEYTAKITDVEEYVDETQTKLPENTPQQATPEPTPPQNQQSSPQ